MSKDIDGTVQDVATALTKTIEAASELVRCALHAWRVIGEARGGEGRSPSNNDQNGMTYSPTFGWTNPSSADDFKRNLRQSLGDHSRSASQ